VECDVNPPVHSWAVWNVYNKDKEQTGEGDTVFLETFQKLLINYTWWVNQKTRMELIFLKEDF
jgi:hypothetical protein